MFAIIFNSSQTPKQNEDHFYSTHKLHSYWNNLQLMQHIFPRLHAWKAAPTKHTA